MKESDLYPIVAKYFINMGYLVFVDHWALYPLARPDIMALSPHRCVGEYLMYTSSSDLVSVEVKKRREDIERGLYQLTIYSYFSDYVFLALTEDILPPMYEKYVSFLKDRGFGLLSITRDRHVVPILSANRLSPKIKLLVMRHLGLVGEVLRPKQRRYRKSQKAPQRHIPPSLSFLESSLVLYMEDFLER